VPRLALPAVTLCAATSVNVPATVRALQCCLDQAHFADCVLLTDAKVSQHDSRIRVIAIPRLTSGQAYSEFILRDLADFISSAHCLVVQWDGFVLDRAQWDNRFLEFDYIGAPWPQFEDWSVGNGGFSLRSRRLLEACRDPRFRIVHPEDVAICRLNRELLEQEYNIRFADRATAERFSFEREARREPTFGFHGVFNMIQLLGVERFWELYSGLDDKSAALTDYRLLMRQIGNGTSRARRRYQLTKDRLSASLRR
jgi:hypothetical protein